MSLPDILPFYYHVVSMQIFNIMKIIFRFPTCVKLLGQTESREKIIFLMLHIPPAAESLISMGASCSMQAIHLFNLCERIISNIKYAPCLALQSSLHFLPSTPHHLQTVEGSVYVFFGSARSLGSVKLCQSVPSLTFLSRVSFRSLPNCLRSL